MKRQFIMAVIAALVFAFSVALGGTKPDFNGIWVLDKSRSMGIPADMEQTMTVAQSAEKIDLEIKIVNKQGERVIKDTYVLNGQQTDFTPQGLTGPIKGTGKRTSTWLPGDIGVAISEETTVETPNGAETTQRTRKWRLLNGGTTLTIDNYVDGPRGSGQSRQTFVRK